MNSIIREAIDIKTHPDNTNTEDGINLSRSRKCLSQPNRVQKASRWLFNYYRFKGKTDMFSPFTNTSTCSSPPPHVAQPQNHHYTKTPVSAYPTNPICPPLYFLHPHCIIHPIFLRGQYSRNTETPETKTQPNAETTGPMTQHHTPEDTNLQQHTCHNLIYCTFNSVKYKTQKYTSKWKPHR